MPDTRHGVPLADLIARSIPLRPVEAVAIVLQLGRATDWAAPPPAGTLVLEPDGTVSAPHSERGLGTGADYATLLHELLPEPGMGESYRVPGGLRLIVARALGFVEMPGFPTGRSLGEALLRFVDDPPAVIVGGLVQRTARPAPWKPRDPAVVPAGATAPGLHRAAAENVQRSAGPTPVLTGDMGTRDVPLWNPSDGARGDAPRRARPHTLRAATLGVAAVVLSFAGSFELVRQLNRAPDPLRPVPAPAATSPTPSPMPSPRLVAPAAGATEVIVGTGGTAQPDAAAPASAEPDTTGRAAGHDEARAVARPLELTDARAYSPSYDRAGSSLIFHADAAEGSRLMRASFSSGHGVLSVATLVDDGARNAHGRLSPDGTQLAYDSDREGERAVYVAGPDGNGARRVSGPGYTAVPTWAPDGRTLAVVRAEPGRPRVWNIWTIDLRSRTERQLTRHRTGQAWPGAWFPDDRQLCYTHEDRIYIVDTITGDARSFRSPRRGRLARTAAVSPDGRYIAFQVYRDGLWVLDLSTGRMRKLLDDPTAEEFAWSPDGDRLAYHSRATGRWGLWELEIRDES